MVNIILALSFAFSFLALYDLPFALLAMILLIIWLIITLIKTKNIKISILLLLSILQIILIFASIVLGKDLYIVDINKLLIYFLLFKYFINLKPVKTVKNLAYLSIGLITLQTITMTFLTTFMFTSPLITSEMTNVLLTIGTLINISFIVIITYKNDGKEKTKEI